MIILLFMLAFNINSAEWPRPNPANCEFYQKLETQLNCHKEGIDYLSHYAPFYCEAFMSKGKKWESPLREWASKTGVCLQDMLYEQRSNPGLSCKTLESIAFKTHTACYNEADICQLSPGELFEVLKVIKLKDFFTEFKYSHKEIMKMGTTCLKKWI